MIRLLHLHTQDADHQTTRAAQQLSEKLGPGFQATTLTLGSGGDARNALAAFLGLRRARDYDLLHAWGFQALTAAAFSPVRRLIFTPPYAPTRRQIGWLRAIMGYRDVHVVCPSSTLRRTLVERGVPIDRCHLIRPGVDFARLRPKSTRAALRAALGLDDVHEVLLLPGESTRAADHRQGAWAATIVNILDRRTRVLTWGRGPQALAVADFAARLAQPELVIPAEQRLGQPIDFEDLLPAADVLLVPATAPDATLPIATAMAAGLPAVATVTATVAELLEDRHTALMTQPNVPRLLAKRLLDLRDDPTLRWKLADTARTEAYEFFSLTRFLDPNRQLYRQASAGQQVEIPDPAPGAGQRFQEVARASRP